MNIKSKSKQNAQPTELTRFESQEQNKQKIKKMLLSGSRAININRKSKSLSFHKIPVCRRAGQNFSQTPHSRRSFFILPSSFVFVTQHRFRATNSIKIQLVRLFSSHSWSFTFFSAVIVVVREEEKMLTIPFHCAQYFIIGLTIFHLSWFVCRKFFFLLRHEVNFQQDGKNRRWTKMIQMKIGNTDKLVHTANNGCYQEKQRRKHTNQKYSQFTRHGNGDGVRIAPILLSEYWVVFIMLTLSPLLLSP